MNNKSEQEKINATILHLDPMNHFIRFEDYWQNKNAVNEQLFTFLIRDELPQQTYLNLATWYSNIDLNEESKAVLEACPEKNDEILYWLAWLHRNDNNAQEYLKEANDETAYLVFPFRSESVAVMKWASGKSPTWKSRYYLALIDAFRDHKNQALQLMEEGIAPENFAPYFVLRARLRDSSDVQNIQADLSKAQEIDKSDWRYGKYLAEFLLSQKKYAVALMIIEPYYKKDNTNYMTELLYIQCLVMNRNYESAEKIFDHINILPYEGAGSAHNYYVQTKLKLALQNLKKQNYNLALQKVKEATLWPENLGAGSPYPDMIDSSLEENIRKVIIETQKGQKVTANVIGELERKIDKVGSISDN